MQSGASKGRKKDITMIENVQRRATRMVPGLKDLSYPERFKCFKLPTLAYCRLRVDMIETLKNIRGVYDSATSPVMSMAGPNQRPTRGTPIQTL